MPEPLPPIDFAAVAASADLARIVEATCGAPDRAGRFRCPMHADNSPSLYLYDGGKRWRCWPCGKTGNALDFLVWVDGIDVVEAARRLDPTIGQPRPRRAPRPAPEPRPTPAPAWHEPDWQAAVEDLVKRAEDTLWSPAGRPALEWLMSRELEPDVISRFRLGYLDAGGWTRHVARPDGTVAGLRFERGILMPWPAPGACYEPGDVPEGPGRWVGANVRRLAADPFDALDDGPKLKALSGSGRGHGYPWPDLLPSQGHPVALIVEGEFDALIGWQEAGWLAEVVTVGGATQAPQRSALLSLARCPVWLVATDRDEPGAMAARVWRDRAPHKAHRVLLPHGKDLAEFHAAGGNVREWLASELARVTSTEAAAHAS
jgi:DNA primase